MIKLLLPTSFLSLLAGTLALAPAQDSYPSKVSEVLATYEPSAAEERPFEEMVSAAQTFLEALSDERRKECVYALDDEERSTWTNVPPRADSGGVRLGDLGDEQLRRACDLLASVLSAAGYEKVRSILLADDRLLPEGRPRPGFGAENFWLVIFGSPDAEERWALQLDGHHLALNMAFEAGEVCATPSFVGTQPSAYDRGGVTVRPMAGETTAAYALVTALTEEQLEQALVAKKRGRIASGPGRDGFVPEAVGLDCRLLNEDQRALLRTLIENHVALLPERFTTARLDAITAEMDQMRFAWSGPTADQSDVSYRIQGPSVLIEFACQDLGGNPLDHLHAMVREPGNEYGAALGKKR